MTTPIPPPDNFSTRDQAESSRIETELNTLLPILLGDDDIPLGFADAETYLALLDNFDASDAEKRNFIHILQTLIETVIGIRFGVDPATLELKARAPELASKTQDVIGSTHHEESRLGNGFSAASMATRQPKGGADEHIQK